MGVLTQLKAVSAVVPAVLWAVIAASILVAAVLTLSAAKRRLRRAGERAARASDNEGRVRDVFLTIATVVPALFFFIMVLAGSFHGLVAFGYHTLGWRGGWELLVPATLDGVSLAFAMLAFRAVRRKRSPERSYRVVWASAIASATINFDYEYGQSRNLLAGGYLGLLSLFAMFMFDELLAQFEQGAQATPRSNPKFGLRWLTWPTNTFLAAVAWRNHPPAEGTPGTVLNAVANLERVRANKRAVSRGQGQARDPDDGSQSQHVEQTLTREPVAARSEPVEGDGVSRPVMAQRAKDRPRETDVRLPVKPSTARTWVALWVAMCVNPDLAAEALTDDDRAIAGFGVRARQLRSVRLAALTGALARRATELGVDLPAEYVHTSQ